MAILHHCECAPNLNRSAQNPGAPTLVLGLVSFPLQQGTVIHFNKLQVQAFLAANTFTITGQAETKLLTEMLPGILKHLGADSLSSLRGSVKTLPTQSADGGEPLATGEEEEGKVPDLVENFEEASKNEANLIESTSEEDKTQRSYWELLLYIRTAF
ncbi:transcription factor BTF3-like [Meles meles]|uniref:transcription factor BTF3-like n=1 Tax=Meles meles TaxID=9662 RepID=UPI001E698921|nr:transcription factor BTF3-like [Meles meles]